MTVQYVVKCSCHIAFAAGNQNSSESVVISCRSTADTPPDMVEAKHLFEQKSKEQDMLSQQYEDNIARFTICLPHL